MSPRQGTPVLTAHDLLHHYLDLKGLTPDLAEWTEEQLGDNPPRLYRLRRLFALFQAFGIPQDPEGFRAGAFIDTEHPGYAFLLQQGDPDRPGVLRERRWAGRNQIPDFFAWLLEYRETLEKALSFNSAVLEASGLYRLAC